MDLSSTLLIVFGLVFILACVAWFFSAQTWRWHTITLVVLNFMAACACAYMTMRTLKTHREWRNASRDWERQVLKTELINERLINPERFLELLKEKEALLKPGDYEQLKSELENGVAVEVDGETKTTKDLQKGIVQLRKEINAITAYRRRAWFLGQVTGLGTGTLKVDIKIPELDIVASAPPAEEGATPEVAPPAAPVTPDPAAPVDPAAPPAEGEAPAAPATPAPVVPEGPKSRIAGIAPKTILYVFDAKDIEQGGKFLGEFSVVQVNGNQIELAPSYTLSQNEAARLSAAKDVVLYEMLPIDGSESFNAMDAEVKQKLFAALPKRSLPEYEHDGQDATDKDPADRILLPLKFKQDYEVPPSKLDKTEGVKFKAGEAAWVIKQKYGNVLGADDLIAQGIAELDPNLKPKYARRLRDYAISFDELQRQITQKQAVIDQTLREIQAQRLAITQTEGAIEKETAEVKALKGDFGHFQEEQKIITDYKEALLKQQTSLLAELRKLFQSTHQMAAEITRLQWEAVREINRRLPPAEASAGTQ